MLSPSHYFSPTLVRTLSITTLDARSTRAHSGSRRAQCATGAPASLPQGNCRDRDRGRKSAEVLRLMVVTILMVLFVCIETELAENIWSVMVGMGGRKQGEKKQCDLTNWCVSSFITSYQSEILFQVCRELWRDRPRREWWLRRLQGRLQECREVRPLCQNWPRHFIKYNRDI